MPPAASSPRSRILVFNAGSSSLKYALFTGRGDDTLAEGSVEGLGMERTRHRLAVRGRPPLKEGIDCPDHAAAAAVARRDLAPLLGEEVAAVGHRIVHGGPDLWEPTVVDDAVEAALERAGQLAPLHTPPSLAALRAARALFPSVPHVAVFDTGFHHAMPVSARTYAIPFDLATRWGIRRYGFHGISCAYLIRRVAELGIEPARRVVICHLGAGSSVTAVLDGQSVTTSMGFTPLEGLPMQTRSGSVDPALVFFLQREAGLSVDEVEHLLLRESGMRALSGHSGDYLELDQLAERGDARARLARQIFADRVRHYVGAYWAELGGVDLLVFSGGIGEHAASARAAVLAPLAAVGWQMDPAGNADGPAERPISPPGSRPAIWVIPTHEAAEIARQVHQLLAREPSARVAR